LGTVFTIDIRDSGSWSAAVDAVVAWLHFVDATFSTFRDDSDISRVRRGELAVADADPHVAEVLELCACAHRATRGYFSAVLHGQVDPTGLVKGWSIERASRLLRELGSANHAINGGGDVQVAGEAAPGRPWTVAVSHPHDKSRVLTVVTGRDFAVATSGIGERGAHLIDPFTGRAAVGLASATVVGRSLTDADTYATAAAVMARGAIGWVESLDGYAALVVTEDGDVASTAGWSNRSSVPKATTAQVATSATVVTSSMPPCTVGDPREPRPVRPLHPRPVRR
jgi:thiamine biosynthesis lipoprotein